MKDQTKTKLARYASVAGSLLGAGAAQGQIDYVDIPDTTVQMNNGRYDIDLDQDGNPDFRMTQYLDTGSTGLLDAIIITPFDSLYSRVAGEPEGGFSYPFKMLPGDSLKLDTRWEGNTDLRSGYLVSQYDGTPYPNSYWKGPVTNGFLGLRIIKNDGFHFGWVRLDVASDNRSFTVKDFGYQTVAEEGMQVGEPTLSAVEHMLEEIELRQSGSAILLSKPSGYGVVNVRILDITGRPVHDTDWEGESLSLGTGNQPAGVYLVEFTSDGLRNTRKILLSK